MHFPLTPANDDARLVPNFFFLLKKSVSNATNDKQSLHKLICFLFVFLWTFNGLIFYYRELETELLLVATHFLQKDKDLRLPKNSKVSGIDHSTI